MDTVIKRYIQRLPQQGSSTGQGILLYFFSPVTFVNVRSGKLCYQVWILGK